MENNKLHILIVDDDDRIRSLLKDYLKDNNYMVSTAENATQAKIKLEQIKFDIIILDVMMPRMSGFEVCQKIKSQPSTRDTVVIMVTALNEISDYERAVECGTNDFITKPVNKIELIARVKSLLELSLVKQEFDRE